MIDEGAIAALGHVVLAHVQLSDRRLDLGHLQVSQHPQAIGLVARADIADHTHWEVNGRPTQS